MQSGSGARAADAVAVGIARRLRRMAVLLVGLAVSACAGTGQLANLTEGDRTAVAIQSVEGAPAAVVHRFVAMLEDEAARERNRERLRHTTDPRKRRRYFEEALERVDRQIALLEAKAERIDAMIEDARGRRDHIENHLAGIEHDHPAETATGASTTPADDPTAGRRRRTRQATR